MRVYASKYVGHGVRVGVAHNFHAGPRTQRSSVPAPAAMRPLLLAIGVTGGVGLVLFPPLLVVTAVLFVAFLVAQTRWDAAKRQARP